MKGERLDILVQHQLDVSRSKAQGLIQTGQVFSLEGDRLDKPGMRLPEDTLVEIREQARFVSRGGDKLEAAFEAWPLDIQGRITLDVGASTGGFTDCMLQHGAAKVYAVDVGYGQLAWRIRQDARVVVYERCNIRHLKPESLEAPAEFFAADCSFISLKVILTPILGLMTPEPEGVVLIKPQFEAGKHRVGKGGVVRDVATREAVIAEVCDHARKLGFTEIDVIPSPLLGPAGNQEFLAWLRGFQHAGAPLEDIA